MNAVCLLDTLAMPWRASGWEVFYSLLIDFVDENKPFSETVLAVPGRPRAGPALLNSHLPCTRLQGQTARAETLPRESFMPGQVT